MIRVGILALTAGALLGAFFVGSAQADGLETEAQMIDRLFLQPHHSRITGEMVVALREWYGIEPLWTLTILGAETSLGDPKLGGRLVGANNFGCMRSGDPTTKWGSLACGTIVVAGKRWWIFPDPWAGMAAWGRLIKIGPTSRPGLYLERLQAGDWRGWSSIYYGSEVSGYEKYLANILHINASFAARYITKPQLEEK